MQVLTGEPVVRAVLHLIHQSAIFVRHPQECKCTDEHGGVPFTTQEAYEWLSRSFCIDSALCGVSLPHWNVEKGCPRKSLENAYRRPVV